MIFRLVIFLQGFGSWSFLQPLWLCFSRILCLLEWKETFDLGILEVPTEAIDDAVGKSILGNDSKMISNRNLMISWDHSRTGICDGIETWWSIIWSNRLTISHNTRLFIIISTVYYFISISVSLDRWRQYPSCCSSAAAQPLYSVLVPVLRQWPLPPGTKQLKGAEGWMVGIQWKNSSRRLCFCMICSEGKALRT